MTPYDQYINAQTTLVEKTYAPYEGTMRWINPYSAQEHTATREALYGSLAPELNWSFKGTKPWLNDLSPGCRICGEGDWSCLFITGRCNANCFYCPAPQESDEPPQTQRLLFDAPEAYADYVNEFGFRGVALSGGEPLMVLDRTVAYLETARRRCRSDLYVWVYTNGILATEERLKRLAEAGVDEVRFDLGAVNYNPEVLKPARGWIPRVTVEIPAVPEEATHLEAILERLVEYGVTNLNLHQLRLTPHNAPKLLKRTYTYLHDEAATVMESELAALRIMATVRQRGLPLGVNYCNFQYKNRFQKAGFRRRMGNRLKKEGETVTENGFLRSMDPPDALDPNKHPLPDTATITYRGRVIENLQENRAAQKFHLGDQDYPIKEGLATAPIILTAPQLKAFKALLASNGTIPPEDPTLFKLWQKEFTESGRREWL